MSLKKPLRSALYVPCDKPRALEKARALPADALILDLEDAVSPEAKDMARDTLVTTLMAAGFGAKTVCVRVNALSTPWGKADVAALAALPAPSRPSAVALPKAESAHDIHALDDRMPDGVEIWPLIETPKGVLNVGEIAASSPFITTLVMGTSDLVKDLHARHVPQRAPLLYSLSRVVLVARALGLAALDGVHLDLSDEAGFVASCAEGRAMGFDGKTLIHPKTIAAANAAFGPDAAEIAHAKALIAAWQARGSQSVIVVDGQLVENLHIIEAERLLALAAHIELLEKDSLA